MILMWWTVLLAQWPFAAAIDDRSERARARS